MEAFEYANFALLINAVTLINFLVLIGIISYKFVFTRSNFYLLLIFITPLFLSLNNLTLVSDGIGPLGLFAILTTIMSLIFPFAFINFYRSFVGEKIKLTDLWAIVGYVTIIIFIGICFHFTQFSMDEFMRQFTSGIQQPGEINMFGYTNALVTLVTFGALIHSYIIAMKVRRWTRRFGSSSNQLDGNYLFNFVRVIFLFYVTVSLMYAFFDALIVELIIYPIIMNLVYIYILITTINNSKLLVSPKFDQLQIMLKRIRQIEGDPKTSEKAEVDVELYWSKIVEAIWDKKLYAHKRLTIGKLSEESDIPVATITQCIKQNDGSNFFDFVNRTRVEAAIQLMEHPDSKKYTLEAIGDEVGFNSRTSFYRAFKKFKKCSPGAWMLKKKEDS